MLDALRTKRLPSRPRMTRAISTSFLLGSGLVCCAISPGCKDEGVGDPCTPEQEYDPSFLGFDEKEVNVESKSFQCRTRICLVNHFRGRASCPYGQSVDGAAAGPAPKDGCHVPGTTTRDHRPHRSGEPDELPRPAQEGARRRRSASIAQPTRPSTARAAAPTSTATSRAIRRSARAPTASRARRSSRRSVPVTKASPARTASRTNTAYNKDTACNQGDCDPNTNKCASQ